MAGIMTYALFADPSAISTVQAHSIYHLAGYIINPE